jgi:hypothetical protein
MRSLGVSVGIRELLLYLRAPIRHGRGVVVRAERVRTGDSVHHVVAELSQGGTLCVRAAARFVDQPPLHGDRHPHDEGDKSAELA